MIRTFFVAFSLILGTAVLGTLAAGEGPEGRLARRRSGGTPEEPRLGLMGLTPHARQEPAPIILESWQARRLPDDAVVRCATHSHPEAARLTVLRMLMGLTPHARQERRGWLSPTHSHPEIHSRPTAKVVPSR